MQLGSRAGGFLVSPTTAEEESIAWRSSGDQLGLVHARQASRGMMLDAGLPGLSSVKGVGKLALWSSCQSNEK